MPRPHPLSRSARSRRISGAFLLAWAVIGVTIACLRAARPGLEIGFAGNDAHILCASRWFAQHGHWGTLAIPPRQTAPRADGSWQLYNTYPAGVFWLHEIRRALGVEALWGHRVLSVAWNHAAILGLFLVARRVTRDALIAAVAAGLVMLSAPYVTNAGGLWEHAPMLTLVASLGAWWRFERARSLPAQRGWGALAVLACIADNFMTIQHAPMVGAIVAVRAAWLVARRRRGRCAPGAATARAVAAVSAGVLLAPVAVMGFRFAEQAYLSGGVHAAAEYFTNRAENRMGMAGVAEKAPPLWPTVAARLGLPLIALDHGRAPQCRFPLLHPVALAGAAVVLGLSRRRAGERGGATGAVSAFATRRALGAGALLLAASMTWPVLFKLHAALHPFVMFMSIPAAALIAGAIIARPLRAAPPAAWRGGRIGRVIALAGAAAVAGPILGTLTRSELLNAFVAMDPVIAPAVARRAAAFQARERAGRVIAGAEVLETHKSPITGYLLGLPYRDLTCSVGDLTPEGPTAVAIALDDARGRRTVPYLSARAGIPVFASPPGDMVFWGHGAGPGPGSVGAHPTAPLCEGATVAEVVLRPTIDGRGWTAAALIVGHAAREVARAGGEVLVDVRGADRRVLAERRETLPERSLRCDGAALVVVHLGLEVDGWREAEIAIRPERGAEAKVQLLRP